MKEVFIDKLMRLVTIEETLERIFPRIDIRSMADGISRCYCPIPGCKPVDKCFKIVRAEQVFRCDHCEQSGTLLDLVQKIQNVTAEEAMAFIALIAKQKMDEEVTKAIKEKLNATRTKIHTLEKTIYSLTESLAQYNQHLTNTKVFVAGAEGTSIATMPI